ncbi:hypothetical protein LCGC14_1344130, partial [marine sediment metagenome]
HKERLTMSYLKIKGVMPDGRSYRTIQVNSEGQIVLARPLVNIKKIRVRTAIEANGNAHAAGDILSNSDTDTAGLPWIFRDAARIAGGSGHIVQAAADTQVESQTYSIALQVYTKYPTCELDDNAAAASPNPADGPYFVDEIVIPQMSSRGDNSYAVATPSTAGNLPLAFVCENGSRDLYVVAIAVDSTSHTATEWLDLTLYIEQY